MTWLDQAVAGLDETRRRTVRTLLEQLGGQPPATRRARLRELTGDAATIALVETLLEQHTRVIDGGDAQASGRGPATELQAGDTLGHWRLRERIASGGMGTVFSAIRADDLYRQHVAIKLLHGHADPGTAARLASERQVLARLQHPGIARLYDGGTTPAGNPYLVMEFVDGQPLHHYCKQAKPGLARRIALFQGICRAVDYAHRHMIVHCDLKPGNVLVDTDGNPVLLDFGVARARGSDEGQPGYCTPAYASPELLDGAPVSASSDVFSLGVLLLELLSARRVPADGDNRVQELPAPSALAGNDVAWRRGLRGDLDAIVARACARDPGERYASVGELCEDLQRHLEHRPVRARANSAGYRFGRLLRRRFPEAAGLTALALLSGVFVWQLAEQRDVARHAAATASEVTELLASALATADPKDGRGNTDLSARDVVDASAARLGEIRDPAALARLREVLGNAYLHLGQPDRAEPLMDGAVDGYLDEAVRQPLSAARVLAELAVLHANSGHKRDAIAVARRGVELNDQHLAPPLAVANALNSLGIALTGTDNDEAGRVLGEALDLRMEYAGGSTVAVASTLHNLGMLARYRADWKAAEDFYRRALAIKRAIGEADGSRYLNSLSGLAQALRGQDRLAEAAALQREVLDASLQVYGDGKHVADAYNELAYTLHDLGRWQEAAPLYAEAARLAATASGEDSIDFAVSINNHASLDEDRGALDAAEQGFRRSLGIRRAALAPDSDSVLRATLNLGRLLLREGRLEQAGPLIEQGWTAWRANHAPDHPASVGHRLLHAEWLLASGEGAEAKSELQALAGLATTGKHVAWLHTLLADVAQGEGDPARAIAERSLALQARARELGEDHVEVARLRVAYAEDLLAAGDRARASEQLQLADSVLGPALAPRAPLRGRIQRLGARLDRPPGDRILAVGGAE